MSLLERLLNTSGHYYIPLKPTLLHYYIPVSLLERQPLSGASKASKVSKVLSMYLWIYPSAMGVQELNCMYYMYYASSY